MASIVKYEGKNSVSFQVRYRIDGKQKTKSFKALNNTKTEINRAEREANRFAKEIEAEKTLGVAILESNMTFSEYAENFFKIHSHGKKESTKLNYSIYLRKLNMEFGEKKMQDITPTLIDAYFLKLKERGLKQLTLRKYRDILSLVLKSANKKDLIKSNPLEKIDFSFKEDSEDLRVSKVVNFQELPVLFHSFQVMYYKHLILLGMLSGMRTGEMLALTWSDVDLEKRIIKVNKSINHLMQVTRPKSKSSIREIYIPDALHHLFLSIMNEIEKNKCLLKKSYNDNNLVICKEDGSFLRPQQVASTMYEKSKTLGINFNMHQLRHTYATLMSDANIKDIQALLGHSKADISVNTYQHQIALKDDTKEKLNTVFNDVLRSLL